MCICYFQLFEKNNKEKLWPVIQIVIEVGIVELLSFRTTITKLSSRRNPSPLVIGIVVLNFPGRHRVDDKDMWLWVSYKCIHKLKVFKLYL